MNNSEKSQLRDWSKLWKMFYLGGKMGRCADLEKTVKASDYADSTKKKGYNDLDEWAARYDETGRTS